MSHDRLDPDVAEVIELLPVRRPDRRYARRPCASASRCRSPTASSGSTAIVPGDPAVPVRVHRPKEADGVLPCVYSIHGGGYVLGTNLLDDPILDELCPALGVVGVSVEYRLAPETPYPGPLEDCYRGLQWTLRARRGAGHRPELHRRDGRERGRRSGRRAVPARARPRRGAGRLPAPRPADARRPPDHAVEPGRRPRGVEPRLQHVRVEGVPRRSLRPRRRAADRGAGPGDRPLRPAAHVRVRRRRRRLPRRRHRLRDAAQPGRRADRAARVPGRVPRLQRHGGRRRAHEAVHAQHGGLVGEAGPAPGDEAREPRRRPVPPGAGTPGGEVHGDLGRRPRRRAAAHLRGAAPGRAAGPGAADRRDAPRVIRSGSSRASATRRSG